MQDQQSVLSLIGLLYDATLDVNKWQAFLEKCCAVFNSSSAQCLYGNSKTMQLSFSSIYNLNIDDLPSYVELCKTDPRNPLNLDKPWHPGQPDNRIPNFVKRVFNGYAIHDRMLVSTEDLHATEIYQKLLKPNGIEYTCSITYRLDEDEIAIFSIMRHMDLPEFTLADCELFGQLSLHIKQAVLLHLQLSQLDFDRRMALDTLDNINLGLVLADNQQQVLFANPLGQAMLAKADGFSVNGQNLSCCDVVADQQLKNAIEEVIQHVADGKPTQGRAFLIPRPSGKSAYSVLVSPIWNNLIRVQSDTLDYPIVSIFIQDPETIDNTQNGLLKEAYQLSKREFDVLAALLQGNTTANIAQQLGIQENTVRQYLKYLFAKTNTKSQAELIQTVMASPFWLGSHEFSS